MGIDTELSLLCGLSLSVSMLMTGAIGSLFSADFKKHSKAVKSYTHEAEVICNDSEE
jgi:hypothetical protein